MPRTGLEPARRETHAPETCASTNSATWAYTFQNIGLFKKMSGKRDSDPRPRPWQGRALPTELLPHCSLCEKHSPECECKGTAFFLTCKLFEAFFSKNLHFLHSTLLYIRGNDNVFIMYCLLSNGEGKTSFFLSRIGKTSKPWLEVQGRALCPSATNVYALTHPSHLPSVAFAPPSHWPYGLRTATGAAPARQLKSDNNNLQMVV